MRALIAGGGTGGHVFPAMAVAGELVRRGVEIMFVGTKKGLESELVPKKGWRIEYLSAPRWKGESKVSKIKALLRIPFVTADASKIISSFDPDIVIGVGGYASVPTLVAARLNGIPLLIMEQNALPGLANRLLGWFANRICISFPVSEHYFSRKKVVFTGNPVRDEIREASSVLPPVRDKLVVLCFGGSQGAKSINEAMFASLRFLRNKRHALRIIHAIGWSMNMEVARDIYQREGFDAELYRFAEDIADCYARAHLVICRAGATSIAELMVAARPAVLVPYPYAAGGHQEENARCVAEGGGAIVVMNRDLSGEKIAELIGQFMNSPEKLLAMSMSMKEMARPYAAEMIAEECLKLANQAGKLQP